MGGVYDHNAVYMHVQCYGERSTDHFTMPAVIASHRAKIVHTRVVCTSVEKVKSKYMYTYTYMYMNI